MGTGMEAEWSRVLDRLRSEFDGSVFNSWFKPLALVNIEDGCAVIAAPTRFMRTWLESNYADRIRSAWKSENPSVSDISFIVLSGFSTANQNSGSEVLTEGGGASLAGPGGKAHHPATKNQPQAQKRAIEVRSGPENTSKSTSEFGAPLDPRFTFDSFVVGKSNELAYAAARRVAENKEVHFNPLFLHSGVGLGKTHLMHAIACAHLEKFPERRVVYLSAEQFMYQFITSIRYKDTMSFKQKFRSVDLLMIDDLQFIANKQSTQEEFFHTFNALIDHSRQVIISADRSPTDMEGIEERIRSRLGWGLVADIYPTDYELRLGILQQKANKVPEVDISLAVLEFLARRVTSNVRELEGALNRMIAHATLIGRPITLEMTQEVLKDLLRANVRRVSIDEIQRRVADYFNIRLSDLLSSRRARQVARPRQVAMYLAKKLTAKSLPVIGREFGGRDHTTVMHAVKRIDELRLSDSGLEEDIQHLERIFGT